MTLTETAKKHAEPVGFGTYGYLKRCYSSILAFYDSKVFALLKPTA